MTGTREASTVWVCVDCFYAAEGLELDDSSPDREPLSLIGEAVEVTAGLLAGEHADDCPNVTDGEWTGETECECERHEFSWSACHGCGSTLGGAREALTVWSKPDYETALDVWLRIPDGEEESEAEANTYRTADGYQVDWYLTAVGLVKSRAFATWEEARAWLTAEGFDDYSS